MRGAGAGSLGRDVPGRRGPQGLAKGEAAHLEAEGRSPVRDDELGSLLFFQMIQSFLNLMKK